MFYNCYSLLEFPDLSKWIKKNKFLDRNNNYTFIGFSFPNNFMIKKAKKDSENKKEENRHEKAMEGIKDKRHNDDLKHEQEMEKIKNRYEEKLNEMQIKMQQQQNLHAQALEKIKSEREDKKAENERLMEEVKNRADERKCSNEVKTNGIS